MAKTKASKRVVKKKDSDVIVETVRPVKPSGSLGKKLLTWVGWGIVYVFVFYLGNLSGEYVAAHLPILPSLPRISINTDKIRSFIPTFSLPKVSVAWKWPTFQGVMKTTVTPAVHTKLVVVRGNFINMPEQAATEDERKAFVESVNGLALDVKNATISESCEVNPPFIRVKQGESLTITSSATSQHTLTFDQMQKVIPSRQTISVPLAQNQGAFPISCDGTIVGFYRVY